MRKALAVVLAFGLLATSPAFTIDAKLSPEQKAVLEKYRSILASLHPQFGEVPVSTANAVLHLGNNYYFLNASEAKKVLTEGWGNAPDAVRDTIGMVFPAGKTFLDDTWGAVITYRQTGYVSDSDAQTTDYDKMLEGARSQEDNLNESRRKSGFPTQHLVGWAQPPVYDAQNHSVVWARDIRFADQKDDTLNYDVRMLGRRGVLSLNMVSNMSKLSDIRSAAAKFSQAAAFETGSRYSDFNSSTDKAAGYGIAGLVAAGVGVAAAKKLGFLALVLGFGKKLIILAIALFAGAINWIKRLFRRDEAE